MSRGSFGEHLADKPGNDGPLAWFVAAVQTQQPVGGLTHNFYRYPARFSPQFARAAIEAFSRPGDGVLDPFMGGATTLVEARALGRHAAGSDINALSVFLGRVKTTPLDEDDLVHVADWVCDLPDYLNLRLPPIRAVPWAEAGYQRNLPWPLRKTIELALGRIHRLPRKRQQEFARCILLRVGQWALDCRQRIPSAAEFREGLLDCLDSFTEGMREYRRAVQEHPAPGCSNALTINIQCPTTELPAHAGQFATLPNRPTLIVTSPPYPGVHVLYHRWNVRGRKESPAPFWVADCQDGQGASHYTFGDRRHHLVRYFEGIRESFAGVRQVIDSKALVVQMVAFSEPALQIPRFLESMQDAGYDEVPPESLGIPVDGRIWRSVPGRRWFALIRGSLATSKELVLFHRPRSA
jgi:hypothetical protein